MNRIHHVSEDRVVHSAHREDRPCGPLCGPDGVPDPTVPDLGNGWCEWCWEFDNSPMMRGSLEAVDALETSKIDPRIQHEPCQWKQVGPCVYCVNHGIRLYQGQLPTDRRPVCTEHDWDEQTDLGFYFQCRTCGVKEWT